MNFQEYHIEPSKWKLRDMPAALRPDAAHDRLGVENISDVDLLALLLTGNRKINPVDLASGLLMHFRDFDGIRNAGAELLASVDGMTKRQARALLAALELSKRAGGANVSQTVRTPIDVERLIRPRIMGATQESIFVITLNAHNRLIAVHEVTKGLVDASLVHPREVFGIAIQDRASAIVMAHNHPSGDPNPSAEDIRITRRLIESGRIIDIKVLDHVVIGREALSLRVMGAIEF